MSGDKLRVAFEAVLFMERCLDPEIYFDPDVSEDGKPYVYVSVSDAQGEKALYELFGESIQYQDAKNGIEIVPVIIRQIKPVSELN